ncbi:MAG: hypothetical protein A2747_00365 [Candidatus Yonathbacteria bacterium RIFCSPHIGHO2_01_FULL_44_41]|uniref:Rhodanese domain-containing protein n=1 Tax=Candidatus Yonathbacteria bacterium RIFCSPHIGHO2_02_FULL_44_14 TaxID=1802724 RepID=A0A1G2SA77_9BACT|nr:MAG: hypothetical protein A2747_00365 [Candidatus Yonathbacteria bacterium RIFCSPHIGHO2_01_FULL_44_41]OHA81560.1 MAG: hypothetical protein A3B06_02115 [Candidatus Yonathbacteria bacterium RIFCSPLOWO2_01_FULL_43_20]OHA81957.1 MAG: hypothetical protein A3D51_03715 [Candidatus Yonathbacteria bacterium RIFCSPHIGHO2_02_FULL_44_14]
MKNILPEEAQKIIENGEAMVVDVRTPDEFAEGHINGAQNININDPLFSEKVSILNKEASYVVNCLSGGRSSRATSLLYELGFKNVMNLEGGITAWKKVGMPVEK